MYVKPDNRGRIKGPEHRETMRQNRRLTILIIILALVFSILVVRITKIMFFQKDILLTNPNLGKGIERGFITDRNGEKLALSLETYSIYARPSEIQGKKGTAQLLSRTLNIPYERILKSLNSRKPFVWVQRQVDVTYSESLEGLDIEGIYLEKEYKRYYPFKQLAAHVVGFAGIDQRGLEGIEYHFDEALLPKRIEGRTATVPSYRRGYTVVLTIDRYIQEIVEEELQAAYNSTGARLISAIVMHPSTGEILAVANQPGYDLNNFNRYSDDVKRNKAITDSFEPGSTFKIFIAATLMNQGLVDESDSFVCRGSIDVYDVTIHDTDTHNELDFREVLERSCNVGMIKSVDRIEASKLYDQLRDFGFGEPTGINLPGEARGILRNPKDWSGISKYMIAIGQEVSVTPLQLVSAASALANGGILMQPRIVKRIEKPDGSILKEYNPIQLRRVVESDKADSILDILVGVLSDRGTGYKARLEGYNVAGKTGTAQIADTVKGGYMDDQFYASFVGFLPVPDPKIVILVTLDRPVGETYGGQTAAPIFKNIVERIAPYLNILPSFSEIYILQ
jgi:cell division protein FtsI/penicillin-binding protein 2